MKTGNLNIQEWTDIYPVETRIGKTAQDLQLSERYYFIFGKKWGVVCKKLKIADGVLSVSDIVNKVIIE